MSEHQELGQRYIAALWDTARSLGTDERAHAQLASLMDAITDAEAQLAGLRLRLLHEARLAGAEAVIAETKGSVRTTTAQATSALKLSLDLAERFPLIGTALSNSVISLAQAEAIVTGLKKLPNRLTRTEFEQCQHSILEYADELGPSELRTLASRLVEVVSPEEAEADEAKRLAAEERAARRGRFLRLSPDHHGSMRITGQLPIADAALLAAQLDALMPSTASYSETGQMPTPEMRRADALVLLCQTAANTGALPQRGGDRPTVHITMDLETLTTGLGKVGVFGPDGLDGISAGEARRLACDANLIPIVLGGKSKPLDVGQTSRTFPPAIRAAITERDQGCAFPGCNAPASGCEAHHIIPYLKHRGPSSLSNGVLVCPHHHRLVEPDPLQSAESQWQVHLDSGTGLPVFTPPTHIDPRRRPRQHTRYVLQQIKLEPAVEAPPCPPEDRATFLARINQYTSPAWTQAT